MQSTLKMYIFLLAGVILLPFSFLSLSTVHAAGVCSQGTGIPPFLDSGAGPNLLLVLDNSGSMLDMAYVDNDTQCFDDGYIPGDTYGGYFEEYSWYVWEIGSTPWDNVLPRAVGDEWTASWEDGETYSVGEIVYANGGLYRAVTGGTADDGNERDGFNLIDDVGVQWEAVSQAATVAELPETCNDDELVSYNNSVHICKTNDWSRLEGGQFLLKDKADALNDCSLATGNGYIYVGEVCITVESETIAAAPPLPEVTVQKQMNAFAARGNFLNWASSSKFDIQKKILTGGKYDSETKQLIGESRGCAGSGFVKQVPMVAVSDSSTEYLTMRVRGAGNDDRVGDAPKEENSDDTTRIEIVGVSDTGFNQGECQIVIDTLIKNPDNVNQNLIDNCLSGTNEVGISQAALSTSVNVCRMMNDIVNPTVADVPNLVTTVAAKCEDLFTNYGYSPSAMSPEDGGYACYGIYDNDQFPTNGFTDNNNVYWDHRDRGGYLGRCWQIASSACNPRVEVSALDGGCDIGEPDVRCTYCGDLGPKSLTDPDCQQSDQIYKNEGGYNFNCIDPKGNAVNGYYCKTLDNAGDWGLQYAFDNDDACDPGDASGGVWDPTWLPASSPSGPELACVSEAMIDFCGDLKVPEVIDPSDQATTTTDFWNVPAMLIDGGVLGQLGVAKPLAVMKGFIQYEPSEEQQLELIEIPERPEGPRGVMFDVASDLRLGVMAFTDNGAKTECDTLQTTCTDNDNSDIPDVCEAGQGGDPTSADCAYCNERKSIVQFCPDTNSDGARVLQPVKYGMQGDDISGENWDHYNNLVVSVNSTRATAWTPLGEAMFTAIGYFTQNEDFCLDNDDVTGECLSFPIDNDDDPIKYWCQDNNVLIITEGASTADINADLAAFVTDPNAYFVTLDDDDIVGDNDVTYGDESRDVSSDNNCADGLDGSTYLDDMTWWGRHVQPLYAQRSMTDEDGNENDKQIITTHIVTTGSLRSDGTGECSPKTLMEEAANNGGRALLSGEDPATLEANLRAVFSDILSRASAGSAASVISSSRSGSGAVYQAIFWPELTDNQSAFTAGDDNTVNWVGDVHALFISANGLMYEDTGSILDPSDGKLEPSGDLNNNGSIDNDEIAGGDDRQVIFYYSENVNKTRGCYNITDFMTGGFVCPDDPDNASCGVGDDCVEIQDIQYLWSASKKLRDMNPDNRKIFTWNDFNNDGIVDVLSNEFFEFKSSVNWNSLNLAAAVAGNDRGSVTKDFLTSSDWATFVDNDGSDMELDAMNALVAWIRGVDQLNDETADDNGNLRLDKKLRSRQFYMASDSQTKEWRLGDIIHSTPIVVARPAEAYHFIYRDPAYSRFVKKWAKRRNMIYYGANDGMLHAVNGGFYSESLNQFCCTPFPDNDECAVPVSGGLCSSEPDLGDEKWAYIPYNLQPHLKCLADPDYVHKYFVDQNPRIFDVQIFEEDIDHVGGWGTILVGSMRFGGAPVLASSLNGDTTDKREFTSSFFILDITNPEVDPVLLGEITRTTEQQSSGEDKYVDLNYTTSVPTMVVMRDNDNFGVSTDWYLVMGNGPTDLDGTNDNDEQGRLAILPLEWLLGELSWGSDGVPTGSYGSSRRSLRIFNEQPDGGNDLTNDSGEGGVFLIPRTDTGQPSYVSDMITVDFDVENAGVSSVGALYRSDAVYFGTTDGTGFANYPAPDNDNTFWNGGGRLFRLVTKVLDGSDNEITSKPSEWAAEWSLASVDNDNPIRMMVDVKAPITAAPSVGYDGYNFWVYAGTGHFYDKKDKTDNGRPGIADPSPPGSTNGKISYFGIREPIEILGNCYDHVLTWDTINWNINDNDNDGLSFNGTPGDRGLMQVDNIIVADGGGVLDCVHCTDNDDNRYNPECDPTTGCFNSDFTTIPVTFNMLRNYIAGDGCADAETSTGIDGWYRDFHEPRERNIGQAALLGGLLTFTGYQPYNDICQAEGESFLYGVQFQTGVAWTESVFGNFDNNGKKYVLDKLSLGRGLATTPSMHVGQGDEGPAKAFVQTTTGEIIEIIQESLPFDKVKSGRTGWTDRCE